MGQLNQELSGGTLREQAQLVFRTFVAFIVDASQTLMVAAVNVNVGAVDNGLLSDQRAGWRAEIIVFLEKHERRRITSRT